MSAGKKVGRPSKMTEEVQAEILGRISTGESLRQICGDKHLPAPQNVFKFIYTNNEFRDNYEAARREQAEWLGEGLIDIADGDGDTQRDRLLIDTRKWVMSKLLPKKYSDKIDLDVSGDVDVNITIGGDSES